MRSSMPYPAPNVSYKTPDFIAVSANAILKQGVFVLTDLPETIAQAAENMYQYGDTIFDKIETGTLQTATLNQNTQDTSLNRVSHKREGFGSSYWAHRVHFAMNQNEQHCVDNIPLLAESPQAATVQQSAQQHYRFVQDVFKKVLLGLEIELQLKLGSLQESCLGASVAGVTRYLPATQARLQETFNDEKLILLDAEKQEILAFAEHKDISPLVAVNYRDGKSDGLMGEYIDRAGNKQWAEFQVPKDQPAIIFFAGRLLEILTNGHITPLSHFVSINAEQQQKECKQLPHKMRFLLASYGLFNFAEVAPALTVSGMPIAPPSTQSTSFPATDVGTFMQQHFTDVATNALKRKITDRNELAAILQAYPAQSEYDRVLRAVSSSETEAMLAIRAREMFNAKAAIGFMQSDTETVSRFDKK